MTATIFATAFCGVFIFLVGRWIGKLEQESATRQRIKNTGLFMLNDGFYTATKINIDTNKPRQIVEPEMLLQAFRQPEKTAIHLMTETPLHDTALTTFKQPETENFESDLNQPVEPPKKRINRRKPLNASTH